MVDYKKKLISAKEAVKLVKSNDWIDYGLGVGIPHELDIELAKRVDELENVNIRGTIPVKEPEVLKSNKFDESGKPVFTWNS